MKVEVTILVVKGKGCEAHAITDGKPDTLVELKGLSHNGAPLDITGSAYSIEGTVRGYGMSFERHSVILDTDTKTVEKWWSN